MINIQMRCVQSKLSAVMTEVKGALTVGYKIMPVVLTAPMQVKSKRYKGAHGEDH